MHAFLDGSERQANRPFASATNIAEPAARFDSLDGGMHQRPMALINATTTRTPLASAGVVSVGVVARGWRRLRQCLLVPPGHLEANAMASLTAL